MTESKIRIPIDVNSDKGSIVGILRRQNNESSNQLAKPIILILHGVLAHKDQIYHRSLAQKLPCDSFRFDFRHSDKGGESSHAPGESWHMSNFGHDVIDIHTVILHLRKTFNYHIESVIAHSRGVLDMWAYFWDVEMRKLRVISNDQKFILDPIPFYVALSGRWNMERMRKRYPDDGKELVEKGYFTWDVKVAGKVVSVKVTKEMVDGFCNFPVAELTNRFPAHSDVLLIHGTNDSTVPLQDVFAYLDKLQNHMPIPRRPGSTDLHIIEGTDHNFKGSFDKVVEVVCEYLDRRRRLVHEGNQDASPAAKEFQKSCTLPSSKDSKL